MRNRILLALGALLCLGSALMGVQTSGATWVDTSTYDAHVTGGDWTPPVVSLDVPSTVSPGAAVTVTATAYDEYSSIDLASVSVELFADGSWSPLTTGCSSSLSGSNDNQATYTCAWVSPGSSGGYQLRASATDTAGNSATAVATTTVTAPDSGVIVLDPMPGTVNGTVVATATFYSQSSLYTQISYRRVGDSGWTSPNECGGWFTTYQACSLDTTKLTDGQYEIRAEGGAMDGWHLVRSDDYQTITVDNTAPGDVGLVVPAGNLSGTVALTATATDATSGLATLAIDYRTGNGAWTTCGTGTTSPYTCHLDTSSLTSGASYDFRVTATDQVGNKNTAVVNRTVDNTPASVSITSPAGGSVIDKSTTISVDATSPRGVTGVTVTAVKSGGSTISVCTMAAKPYACAWNTTALSAGSYDLRATVSQGSGPDVTSSPVSVGIDHNPGTVALTNPGPVSHKAAVDVAVTATAQSGVGGVTLTVTPTNPSGSASTLTCTKSAGGYTCPWDLGSVAYGSFQLQAQMTQGNGFTVTSSTVAVVVDNTTGSVSINPLNPLPVNGKVKGVETLAATTSANAPITSVRYDVVAHGGSSWAPLCTPAATPYTCPWDTTKLANGSYDLRAVMTLVNGATFTSSTMTTTVDNVTGSVSINPLNPLPVNGKVKGVETLAATTSANVSITSVRYDVVAHGGSSWTSACPPTASPYRCDWNTTTLANGSYDLRAVMTLAGGATFTSSTVTVVVANLRGVDVQAGNGNGKVEVGDTISFAYSSEVDLATIKAGFTGSPTAVSMTFHGGGMGPAAGPDTLTFGAGVYLGEVTFAQNYVDKSDTVPVTGSMSATTDSSGRTVVTVAITDINLVDPPGPAGPKSPFKDARATRGTMSWTPDPNVQDKAHLVGCDPTAVSEPDATPDADF